MKIHYYKLDHAQKFRISTLNIKVVTTAVLLVTGCAYHHYYYRCHPSQCKQRSLLFLT